MLDIKVNVVDTIGFVLRSFHNTSSPPPKRDLRLSLKRTFSSLRLPVHFRRHPKKPSTKYPAFAAYIRPEYPASMDPHTETASVETCIEALQTHWANNIILVGPNSELIDDVVRTVAIQARYIRGQTPCFVRLRADIFERGIKTEDQRFSRFEMIINELIRMQRELGQRYIFVVRDIDNYLGDNNWALAHLLREILVNNELTVIGTTTEEQYTQYIKYRHGIRQYVTRVEAMPSIPKPKRPTSIITMDFWPEKEEK
ncbi:uncharacterized protein V1518DRAFT_419337 [Limtongia smithiae]|uniref:uncharacterized protein n=1 Tax=Limtongia smithiae TaxID=1125753 RepID=UPI0034CE2023